MTMNPSWDSRLLYLARILVLGTATSFLCQYFGKAFLTGALSMTSINAFSSVCPALALTVIQLIPCAKIIEFQRTNGDSLNPPGMVLMGHALATLATNYSMTLMFAASTFAIKLTEPTFNVVILSLATGVPASMVTLISLPITVCSSILFVGNPMKHPSLLWGTLAALISNLGASFRNLALKHFDGKIGTELNLKLRRKWLCCFAGGGLLVWGSLRYLQGRLLLPPNLPSLVAMGIGSAFFHVAVFYISTEEIILTNAADNYSLIGTPKRFLVVLLLYTFERRIATPANFLGLIGCMMGLWLFICDTKRPVDSPSDTESQEKTLHIQRQIWKFWGITLVLLLLVLSVGSSTHQSRKFLNNIKEPRALHSIMYDIFPGNPSNQGGFFSRDTFAPDGQQRPSDDELQPVSNNLHGGLTPEIESFLQRRLIDDRDNVNLVSQKLTQTSEVIREAQRIHFNLFGDILKNYTYAILFDVSNAENKGDSAISVGEAYFLRRMNLKLLYYATTFKSHIGNIKKARVIADKFTKDKVVILLHGGGNIIAYPINDGIRFNVFRVFSDYQILLFPQSIRPSKNPTHAFTKTTIKHYCCQENFTLVLRDQLSYDFAKKMYQGTTRLLMAPDMAFQIGRVQRFMSPVFDILWLKRGDSETPGYKIKNEVPGNLRVHVSDWLGFKSPKSNFILESAEYVTTQGFVFLQRGRVVITDRLHGHILSTLMDIPHVLIDNDARKMYGYHNTWTKSVENTVYTDNPAEALSLAIGLLEKYNDTLPPILPYLDVPSQNFEALEHNKLISGYI